MSAPTPQAMDAPSLWMDNDTWALYGAHPAFAGAVARFHVRNGDHLQLAMTLAPEMERPEHWEPELARRQEAMRAGQAVHLVGRLRRPGPEPAEDPEVGCLIGFWSIEHGDFQACTLSILLDRQLEGRGLMHAAVAPAIREVFGRYRLHRIMATHLPENLRSARLLRRLGFAVEGYARDFIRMNGRWRDTVLLSLLEP